MRAKIAQEIYFIPGMWSRGDVFYQYLCFVKEMGYKARAIELYRRQEQGFAGLGKIGLFDYVEQVARDIDIFSKGKEYFVFGHSLGSLIAMLAASHNLIHPQALVLLTPAAPRGIPNMTPSVIKCFSEVLAKTLWRQKEANISFVKASYAFFELMPIDQRWSIFRNLVPESSRVIEQVGLWFFDQSKASAVAAQNIKCDTLIISASQDKITPASVVRKIYQKFDDEVDQRFRVDYKEFSDHAHWLLAEPGWEEVIDFTLSWLQEACNP